MLRERIIHAAADGADRVKEGRPSGSRHSSTRVRPVLRHLPRKRPHRVIGREDEIITAARGLAGYSIRQVEIAPAFSHQS